MVSYFFRTYGCQANVADSQGLAQYLDEMGCKPAQAEADADLIVINTCAVREKAEQKLWSYIGSLADIKKERPYLRVGVIGCVASYKKQEIYKRFDLVNFVYGAREELEALRLYLTDVITSLETTKQLFSTNPTSPLVAPGQDRDIKKKVALGGLLKGPRLSNLGAFKKLAQATPAPGDVFEVARSYINIMTGCNKYCAYCIVPVTRGREVSYPMSQIVARAQHDVLNGAKEITLVGQNVNSYIDPETGSQFPELLRQIAKIPGEFWVRYVSPHPQDMTEELFDVMAQYRPKITAYSHFPVQAGSDRVLKLMNRNYSIETYLMKIGWLRDRMPDATISTDIIVGFPSETDAEFEQTMDVVEKVGFDLIYSFIYSPRKYTKAAQMADDCPLDVKGARLERLQKRQMEIAFVKNSANIGKTMLCLVEKRLEHGKLLARTEGNIRVQIDGDDSLIGQFMMIAIEDAGPAHMIGRVVCKAEGVFV